MAINMLPSMMPRIREAIIQFILEKKNLKEMFSQGCGMFGTMVMPFMGTCSTHTHPHPHL